MGQLCSILLFTTNKFYSPIGLKTLDKLIQDCAANDRLSQEKLYRMFYPALFLLCKRFFHDERDALEALNDGMLKVFRNIAAYQCGKGSFFNWVYTIVRNAAIDKYKLHGRPEPEELKDDIVIVIAGNPFECLEWKDIYGLLDVLTPATRVVCSLFYLEGCSIRDIGGVLGLRPGTVKWHLNEARKKLRPVLEKYYFSK
jgi:RNA polymerase sigma factor (sigma-70 family)